MTDVTNCALRRVRFKGAIALVTAALVAVGSSASAAGPASGTGLVAVVVGDKASDAKTLALVAEAAAKEAGWPVAPAALDARGAHEAAACMARDRPLPCLAALMSPRGADRLLFLDVGPSPDEGDVLRLTAIVVLSENAAPSVAERFCRACNDAQLRASASELIRALIRAAAITARRTVVEVNVEPTGAWIYFDGEALPVEGGAAGSRAKIPTYPGAHTVTVEKAGFESALRKVTVAEGETASVSVVLRASTARASKPGSGPLGGAGGAWRTSLGWGLIGAGVAALAAGGVLVALDEDRATGPDEVHAERYFDSSRFGAAVMIGGAVTAGAGAFLLLLRPRRPATSGPALDVRPGGAALTWMKVF